MNIRAYSRRFHAGVTLIGESLPYGVKLADPCFPSIRVWQGMVIPELLSESDEFWGDAEEASPYDRNVAIETVGGVEEVERVMGNLAKRWREMNAVLTASEAAERWGIQHDTLRAALTRGQFDEQIERGMVRKSGGTWILHESAMQEVYGEQK